MTAKSASITQTAPRIIRQGLTGVMPAHVRKQVGGRFKGQE
jgi:hypothetical protein